MQTEIIDDFTKGLAEIKDGISATDKKLTELDAALKKTEAENERLQAEFNQIRRLHVARAAHGITTPARGMVSDECARHFGAMFIQHCARSGRLQLVSHSTAARDALLNTSREILGLQLRNALTTADIPLPTEYSGEFRALIAQFGVVRKAMFPYPIGMGTSKPPRMGARPQFGSIAMSAAIPEGSPTITFASLEPHKIGGLVRVPREIEEQSIVPLGQFLARYGAVEFARAEDNWGFLADGSATYEQVQGIVTVCTNANPTKTVVLGPTKNSPNDALLADFRAMRSLVATP